MTYAPTMQLGPAVSEAVLHHIYGGHGFSIHQARGYDHLGADRKSFNLLI